MRILVAFFILFCHISFSQMAKFSVDKSVHTFEDIREGTQLSHVFKITNSGDAPLIIQDYKVACPCTKIELPKNPILPGETYSMKVTFDSNGKTYLQDRSILLQTNTKKKEEKLRIKVYVIPKEEK